MTRVTATRFHDFSCGHRVLGHEGKCAHLHGHNYRVHFTVQAGDDAPTLDDLGRVLDFSVIKSALCDFLETQWDHRMLLFWIDPIAAVLSLSEPRGTVVLPFNPTAENMAQHLLNVVGPARLPAHIKLVKVVVEETRKCSATACLSSD